jgi:hypothetical protein
MIQMDDAVFDLNGADPYRSKEADRPFRQAISSLLGFELLVPLGRESPFAEK